ATLTALAQLTSRERDVIELILVGQSMKQISAELGISIQTTAKHRMRILEKFAVKNDVQLLLTVFPVMDATGQLPKQS
ncbi:MAG: helix-turn-helix transcriptional regulator, partial [Planctomycetota bacterium]